MPNVGGERGIRVALGSCHTPSGVRRRPSPRPSPGVPGEGERGRRLMRVALLVIAGTFTAGLFTAWARAGELPGFAPAGVFGERVRWVTLESGVRVYLNALGEMDSGRATRVVVYATPNGNTIEQTLGGAKGVGVDWHYDIQHVAAQVRRLREVDLRENVVLVVVQAPRLSW